MSRKLWALHISFLEIYFKGKIQRLKGQTLQVTTILLQIRAHLGLGLGCPIVGDHKYEHAAEIGPPQKLPGACLNRLGIRQSQVRTLLTQEKKN